MQCVSCHRELSIEALDRALTFPCPHCEVWLHFSPRDPYRGSANEIVARRCDCGGVMRWARSKGPVVMDGIWGVKSHNFGEDLPPTTQRYQCEACRRSVEE